ncbi:MAG: PDZ domain-containing protein [Dictyoglomi bacterium]|nr:PDZ domain-containing protein [Dictyoglomota bacterium]
MKRRLYLVGGLLLLVIALLGVNYAGAWNVNVIEFYPDSGLVKLNGQTVSTASKPIIVNNRLYVPIRTVSNLIGATITWNATERYATMYVPDFISMLTELDEKEQEISKLQAQVDSVGVYGDVIKLITENYLYKNDVSIKSLTYSAIKGVVASLYDKYTRFFTPEEVEKRKILLSSNVQTVGIELTRSSGKYIILDVIKGSPAYYAGLMPGDVVKAIDGTYIRDMPFDDVKMMLSSTTSKEVKLDIIRSGTAMTFKVKTSYVSASPFSYSLISVGDKTVAYIRIKTIDSDVVKQMDDALKKIFFTHRGEADAYILDLRGNFGGDLEAARNLLSFFVGGKKVYTLVDGDGNETPVYAPVSQWMLSWSRPIYVLIDEGTTSAAEVFAMAMKSYDRAILVGETTYGKGVASAVYKLDDGSMLVLTAYEVLGPKGEVLNGAGILPHVWSMTLYAKDEAIKLFKNGILHPSDLGR